VERQSTELQASRQWRSEYPLFAPQQTAKRKGNFGSFLGSDNNQGKGALRGDAVRDDGGRLQGEIWLDTAQLASWLSDYLNDHFGKVLRSIYGPERALDSSRIPF
jgi:hypothetical protein